MLCKNVLNCLLKSGKPNLIFTSETYVWQIQILKPNVLKVSFASEKPLTFIKSPSSMYYHMSSCSSTLILVTLNTDKYQTMTMFSHLTKTLSCPVAAASSVCSPGGSDGKEPACNVGDQVQSLGREDPLEKGMATHSSTLAWRIPWTEEPGGLQPMRSQRVRHDWATNTNTSSLNGKIYLGSFSFLHTHLQQ